MGIIYTRLGGGRSSAAAFLYQSGLAVNRHGNFTRQHEGIGMHNLQRQLTLYKGLERFVFRYEQGQEDRLLGVLIEYAGESDTSFDGFDATVLGLKLAETRRGGPVRDFTESASIRIRPARCGFSLDRSL